MIDAERVRLDTRADAIRALRADRLQLESLISLLQFRGCGLRTMKDLRQLSNDWLTHIEEMELIQARSTEAYNSKR
jgi:hypothetical protein